MSTIESQICVRGERCPGCPMNLLAPDDQFELQEVDGTTTITLTGRDVGEPVSMRENFERKAQTTSSINLVRKLGLCDGVPRELRTKQFMDGLIVSLIGDARAAGLGKDDWPKEVESGLASAFLDADLPYPDSSAAAVLYAYNNPPESLA